MNCKDYYTSPIGESILTSDGNSLTGLWFEGKNRCGNINFREMKKKKLPVFQQTKDWLDIYFDGNIPEFTPPMSVEGTDFRREVWDILKQIAYGTTMTYGEIAEIMAARKRIVKMSAQAVGGAVGRNPISIIIPCHRVVGANGSLTGYGGGIERKLALLRLEKAW